MSALGFYSISQTNPGSGDCIQTEYLPDFSDSILHTGRWSLEKMVELSDYSQQLIATHTIDTLLDNITRGAVSLVQATFCRILFLEPNGSFTCSAAYHTNPLSYRWQKGKTEPGILDTIYEKTLLDANPVLIRRNEIIFTEKERWALELQYASSICLFPLKVENVSFGMMILGIENGNSTGTFSESQVVMGSVIANQAANAIERARLSRRLEENRLETVLALAKTIEARDHYTGSHSLQIASLAEKVAERMDCSQTEIQDIRWASLLHDIGKISIPDQILLRAGPLDLEDWQAIKQHPQIGAEIVLKVSNLSSVASYILSHHEHYDGSGYPKRLKGDVIPLGGRILAVIDAYCAITSDRVYRPARTHIEAIEEIKRCSGTHFDPKVIKAFLSLFNA
jgi:putative nucleotidyltransferase with HDIG domain